MSQDSGTTYLAAHRVLRDQGPLWVKIAKRDSWLLTCVRKGLWRVGGIIAYSTRALNISKPDSADICILLQAGVSTAVGRAAPPCTWPWPRASTNSTDSVEDVFDHLGASCLIRLCTFALSWSWAFFISSTFSSWASFISSTFSSSLCCVRTSYIRVGT